MKTKEEPQTLGSRSALLACLRMTGPEHPDRAPVEAVTASERGSFSLVCIAPASKGAGHTCMRPAEWPSRDEMLRELEELRQRIPPPQEEGLGQIKAKGGKKP